ncbi:MAG: DMT family transporter [Acidobacteria bacterium]|nr:DMT family transporter [Acidobacteriota bacterium]
MATKPETLKPALTRLDAPGGAERHEFGRVDLLLISAAIIWGANYSIVKYALSDFRPLAFNGLRFVLASTILTVIVHKRLRWSQIDPEDRWPMIFLGLLGCGLYQVAFIQGMHLTLAGNASLIQATSPTLTAILSASLGHDLLNHRARLGVGICFAGMVIVIWNGPHQFGFQGTTLGNLLILIATILWSVYSVGARRFSRRYGSLETSTVIMVAGTLPLLAVSAPSLAAQDWSLIRPMSWAALAFSGIFAIAISYIIWNHGIRHIGGTRTASFTNLTPIVALLFAWLTLGERPNMYQMLGAATIFLGIYLTRSGTSTVVDEISTESSAASSCLDR